MITELIELLAGITRLLNQECQLSHQDAIDLGRDYASPEMVMTRMRDNWLRWAKGDSSRRKTVKPEWVIRRRSSEYKYIKEKKVYLAYKSSDDRLRLRLEQGYRGRLVFEIWEKQSKRMKRILAFAWEGFIMDSMPCGIGDGRGISIHGPGRF